MLGKLKISLLFILSFSCASFEDKRAIKNFDFTKSKISNQTSTFTKNLDLKKPSTQKTLISKDMLEKTEKDQRDELLIAKKRFHERNYTRAYNHAISFFQSTQVLNLKEEAWILAIQSLEKLNRVEEALEHIQLALEEDDLFKENPFKLHSMRWVLLLKSSSHLEALHVCAFLIDHSKEIELKNFYLLKSKELIQSYLNREELRKVIRSRRLKIFHAQAYFKLGYFFINEKNFRRAKYYFKKVLHFKEEDLLVKKSLNFIQRIKFQKTVDPYSIGVLLPFSGKHSEISRKILHGLQMGFGIFGELGERKNQSPFRLSVIDSFRNPDLASLAIEKLFFNNNVIAILGILLSKTAQSAAEKANALGIPCVSFSQKSNLTQIGSYIFRNALSSQMQIQKLVYFLVEKEKIKNFGILFPNDAYGVELSNVFWNEVKKLNGNITAAQAYRPEETDFKYPLQRLVGLYDLQDRKTEYLSLFKDWIKKQRFISLRRSPPNNLLKPILNFDALFVPDSVKAIGQIAPMLAYYEINDVNLIGTNLWNTPSLLRRGKKKHLQGAFFVDHLFDLSQSKEGMQFLKKYKKIFNEEPNLFSLKAYETAKILRSLIEGGEKTRIGLKNKLSSLKDFQLVLHRVSLNEKREMTQPLSVFTVSQGQIVPVQDK